MFDLQSDEYERCLASGFHEVECSRLLVDILAIGSLPEEISFPKVTDEPQPVGGTYSSSHSYHLRKCCETERRFADAASRLEAPLAYSKTSELQRRQQELFVRQEVQRLATNEDMSPHAKRLAICDGLRRLLSDEVVLWRSVVEHLSLLLALDRLIALDDSVEVLLDEMDLAVVYCRLQCFDSALQHATRASVLLSKLDHAPFPKHLVEKRLTLVRVISNLEQNPDIAAEQSRLLEGGGNDSTSRSSQFLPLLVRFASTAARHGLSSQSFEDLLSKVSMASECVLVFLCALVLPVSMLRRADGDLREPAVRHAREKLLLLASNAATKREIEDVNEELGRVVGRLREKNSSLQLSLVRTAEEISNIVQRCTSCLRKFSFSPNLEFSISVIALVYQRAMVLLQRPIQSTAAAALSTLLEKVGVMWGVIACCDALASVCGSDLIHYTLPSFTIHSVVPDIFLVHTGVSKEADPASYEAVIAGLSARKGAQQDGEDSDEEGSTVHLQPWQEIAEMFFVKLFHDDAGSLVANDVVRLRFAQVIETLYRRCAASTAEARIAAIQVSLASRIYGPLAEKTKGAVSKYAATLSSISAPTASPSWGVVPHLSTVTLHSNTPHADIFVSVAIPSDRSAQHCTRYDGPVVLDRIGKITLRAFAEKDGKRSSTIETHYFVQPRSH